MSPTLDEIAPSFQAACERWPHAPNLQQHYRDLARAYEEEGSSLIELTKSFLEMVCWTVLNELGAPKPESSTPTTTELLSYVLDALGLRNQRGVGPLGKVISAHNKLAEGINELRNQHGSVAHGKDGFIDTISTRHARVYLLSADSVIDLILKAYDGREPNLLTTREPPDRFRHLNERIDAGCILDAEVDMENGVLIVRVLPKTQQPEEAIEMRVPPSELLYHLDRQAYISVLEALRGGSPVESEVSEEEREEVTETPEVEEIEKTTVEEGDTIHRPTAPKLQLLDEYHGRFSGKVHALYEYVIHYLLEGKSEQAEQVRQFVNTLLAQMENLAVVDWAKRESERAAVRVMLKRLIRLANIDGLDESQIDSLLEWLSREIEGESTHE